MLHRGSSEVVPSGGRNVSAGAPPRVLLAVAPAPRLGNPTRWGWPHWLAPAYKAGAQRSTHRPLEDYG